MVNVTCYDDPDEPDCRFQIEGWGLVFKSEIGNELIKYFKEHPEESR